MEINYNTKEKDEIIMKNLENRIRSNQFTSKDKLIEYLFQLRNTGTSIDNEKMQELLNLYDSLSNKKNTPLDMSGYESIGLENHDLIVSKNDDRILNTQEGTSQYTNEFLSTQNKIIANNHNTEVNSNEVFQHMANHQKEELTLMSIDEATSRNNISIEILNKIRFFLTNSKTNPKEFKVDIGTGIFYNIETNEVYEVRKNTETNQYEIYIGSNKVYGTNERDEQSENLDPTIERDMLEQKMDYESRLTKPKVKKLEKPPHMPNAAFTRVGFLVINILTFAILTTMIILLNK